MNTSTKYNSWKIQSRIDEATELIEMAKEAEYCVITNALDQATMIGSGHVKHRSTTDLFTQLYAAVNQASDTRRTIHRMAQFIDKERSLLSHEYDEALSEEENEPLGEEL